MNLPEFCVELSKLSLDNTKRALAILWFVDNQSHGSEFTSGEITREMRDAGLGEPHSTNLHKSLIKSKHVLVSAKKLRIKPTSRETVASWLDALSSGQLPKMDHRSGYISEDIWQGTIGYIGKIALQLNVCYKFAAYDAAIVLARRVIETLLIEAYEGQGVESNIRDQKGDYLLLGGIITDAVDRNRLNLNRDSKRSLKQIREYGNRSAHNRRYIAVKRDLDDLQIGFRVAVDDLLHLANRK
ncbi:DUF4145 domain-containing protein [Planctomicrobium sp.]|nr:DUF4145 domain-containing protein [Planctomicrobium sp.]MDB4733568.1 DUF4145 domain-containing protein [Planctomicrobium sp.]MDB4793120.1 DUF4145 domain-containing protein [bacterium]